MTPGVFSSTELEKHSEQSETASIYCQELRTDHSCVYIRHKAGPLLHIAESNENIRAYHYEQLYYLSH